ncbi:type III-B CRISPR module RAMP protein Cmr4 [bacterium]|nr:type III-B CRISPR module RAMP protein Cmr4 [bacterium]
MEKEKNQVTKLVGLLTQTSLHAGTGQNTGVIDLPIQREGHNGWPCVFGSAVKGALRAIAVTKHGEEDSDLLEVFGPPPNTEITQDYASAIAVTDARLLLLPVRSLTSQFKWVTCPEALNRLKRDANLLGLSIDLDISTMIKAIEADKCIVYKEANDQYLFLEEYRFSVEKNKELDKIITVLSGIMQRDDAESVLKEQLVIVNNDIFSYLVKHAVPVNAHISVDTETKIVKTGALWYEETLPPDTLLYTALIARNSRKKSGNGNKTSKEVMKFVTACFEEHHWLQVGGNETVGMGWCGVKIYPEANSEGGAE